MRLYISVAVFLFFALALIVPQGHAAGSVLLVLGSLVLLKQRDAIHIDRLDRIMIAALLAYFLIGVCMNLLFDVVLKDYDQPSRFLLVVPAFLLLRAFPPAPAALWGGLAVGCISGGMFAAWQGIVQGSDRAGGFIYPIEYGDTIILFAVLCLAGLKWAHEQRHPIRWTALLVTAASFGIIGAGLTGTRGSWIALFPCFVILGWYYRRLSPKKWHIALGLLGIAFVVGTLYVTSGAEMKERWQEVVLQSKEYIVAHDADTSVGGRLEMWRMARMLIKERPILGWSRDGYMARARELVKEGKVDPFVTTHSHVHNEFLDAWVKRGIPGVIVMLAVYFVPLILFIKQFRAGSEQARPYAIAGVLLILSCITFGLTDVIFAHDIGVMTYAFTLSILWALTHRVA